MPGARMRRRKQARDLRKATEGGEDGENTVNASGKVSLFDDDQDEALDFTVNDKFKKRFEHNETLKDKMRLKELEEELGDEDESSESSEDEDGELLTQDINNTILQTLARIKNKDPVIYKPNAKFFTKDDDDDDDDATPTLKQKKEKREKKITVVDMERERILRGDAGEHDSEEEQEHAHEDEEDEGYYEKQKRIKQAFKRAAEPESEDDLFVPRTRTKEEEAKEEEDFSEFARERLADKARDPSATLRTLLTEDALDEDEKFLRNYILGDEWKALTEKERARREKPTYRDIVGQEVDTSEDEEVEQKKEELRRLKNIKKQEILARLKTIQNISGAREVDSVKLELEEEFDLC